MSHQRSTSDQFLAGHSRRAGKKDLRGHFADINKLRVFEATMDERPPDHSESLQLVLAACKFLDLLLVIQSEDFQM